MRRMSMLGACEQGGFVFAALLLASMIGAKAATPSPSVDVVVVKKQPVYEQDSFIGRIQATQIVNLVPRITGFLDARLFKQGADVKKGQLLYVIEPGPYVAALHRAKADVAAAQATLENAKITLDRATKLLHTPAGQRSTYDDAKATEENDDAKLKSAEAQQETAAINLSYTQIHSPIDGRIGATSVNTGNVVGPSTGTLATVVSQNPMYVTFSMPTRDALSLRDKLSSEGGFSAVELRLKLPDGRMDKQIGKLDFASNQISQSTDSLAMQGTIPNPTIKGLGNTRTNDRELTSGEFVTVIVRGRKPVNKIVVPRDAVLSDQVGDYVLIVNKNGKVARNDVKLAQTTPSTATIASGLAIGTHVIVDGIEKVHPGIKADAEVVPSPVAQD